MYGAAESRESHPERRALQKARLARAKPVPAALYSKTAHCDRHRPASAAPANATSSHTPAATTPTPPAQHLDRKPDHTKAANYAIQVSSHAHRAGPRRH